MSQHKFEYPLLKHEVYDGDTVKATLDMGFRMTIFQSVRIAGIDTPELRTRDKGQKNAGRCAKRAAEHWFDVQAKRGHTVMVISMDLDKFGGRIIGDLYPAEAKGLEVGTLGEYMLNGGFARPYDGGKKKSWSMKQLRDMIKFAKKVWPGDIDFVE